MMDGRYIAEGLEVRRNPKQTDKGISMGFVVCHVTPFMGDEVAAEVAEALNLHLEKYPEKH